MSRDGHGHQLGRRLQRRPQIERLRQPGQRLHQPQRIAAQPERIGRGGGRQTHGEQPDQRVQPVGDAPAPGRAGLPAGVALERGR